jgi:23S rRNA pseudouridine2605 synthase
MTSGKDSLSSVDRHPSSERLAKRIARAGVCSRREAEVLIAAGKVSVNGAKVVTPAFNVSEADEVVVNGQALAAKERARMWLYHKPAGLVTTNKDPQGRPTVFEHLPKNMPRVISIGRLDLNSEGLLLLTNDGELSRHLELPATGWKRKYRVRVYGKVTDKVIAQMAKGVTVEGVKYGPIEVEVERAQTTNTWVIASLHEGKNRELRNAFRHFDLRVNRLIRLSYGPFHLGKMEPGEVKEVPRPQLRSFVQGV